MSTRTKSGRTGWLSLGSGHIAWPYGVFTPLALGLVALAWPLMETSPSPAAALAGGGLALWTLIEYLLHRFSFHAVIREKSWKYVGALVHGYHHAAPGDPSYVAAPVGFALPIFLVVETLLALALIGQLKNCTFVVLGLGAEKTEYGIISYSKFSRLLTR